MRLASQIMIVSAILVCVSFFRGRMVMITQRHKLHEEEGYHQLGLNKTVDNYKDELVPHTYTAESSSKARFALQSAAADSVIQATAESLEKFNASFYIYDNPNITLPVAVHGNFARGSWNSGVSMVFK